MPPGHVNTDWSLIIATIAKQSPFQESVLLFCVLESTLGASWPHCSWQDMRSTANDPIQRSETSKDA